MRSAAFSPDGTRIASASQDCSVRLWDAAMGNAVAMLAGHSEMVYSVAFSPDGKRIASASADSSVRLWAQSELCLLAELHMLRKRADILRRSGRVLLLDIQISDQAARWIATICSKADLPPDVTELIELAIIEPAALEAK